MASRVSDSQRSLTSSRPSVSGRPPRSEYTAPCRLGPTETLVTRRIWWRTIIVSAVGAVPHRPMGDRWPGATPSSRSRKDERHALGRPCDACETNVMADLLLIDDDPALIPKQMRLAFPAPAHRVEVARTGA